MRHNSSGAAAAAQAPGAMRDVVNINNINHVDMATGKAENKSLVNRAAYLRCHFAFTVKVDVLPAKGEEACGKAEKAEVSEQRFEEWIREYAHH